MFIYLDHPSDSPWGKSNASRHVRGKSSGGVFCPLTEDSKVDRPNDLPGALHRRLNQRTGIQSRVGTSGLKAIPCSPEW